MHFSHKFYNFQTLSLVVRNRFHENWHDILIIFVLAIIASIASYLGAYLLIDPFILRPDGFFDWFSADTARVFNDMITRQSGHWRSNVHPLFPLIGYIPTYILKNIGIEKVTAVRIVLSTIAALWLSAMFILLRLIGCQKFDAMLFSVLSAISAAAMFWFIVPETYPFASLSLLLGLIFAVLTERTRFHIIWYIGINIITLSITLTNWMVGIFIALVNLAWKQALQVIVGSFILVLCIQGLQKFGFLQSVLMFSINPHEESKYTLTSNPLNVIQSFLCHTLIMPKAMLVENLNHPGMGKLTIQASLIGSGTYWGAILVGLWLGLLGLGLWTLLSTKKHPKLKIVLGLTILGQLVLHLLYGEETLRQLRFLRIMVAHTMKLKR